MHILKSIGIAAAFAVSASSAYAASTLFISEVVDATLPGGLPKYVEITNSGTTSVDLSDFSLGIFNNGNSSVNTINSLSGALASGGSYTISLEGGDSPGNGTFFDTYGFDPDFFNFGTVANGNDTIALFEGPGTALLDVYGVIGVDGTGEVWEYTDGYATRNADVNMGSAIFNPSEWTFSGPNALETGNDAQELALILANTTPGSHTFEVVPLPASVFLLGGALLGFGAFRRRA